MKQISGYRQFACESLPLRCVALEDIFSSDPQVLAQGIMLTVNKERIAIFSGDAIEVWPLRDAYELARPYSGEN